MAWDFDGANDNIIFSDNSTINNATTLTSSIWVWNDALTADMMVTNTKAAAGDGYLNYFDDTGSGSGRTDVFKIVVQDANGDNAQIEGATGSAKQDVWQNVLWAFNATSATGLELWIDGVEDANSPVDVTSVNDLGQANATNLRLGEETNGNRDRNGRLAELAYWDVVLNDSEKVALSKGISPLLIRPSSLFFYVPLIGRYSPEADIVGADSGTVTGATAIQHPPMIYPTSKQMRRFDVAAAAATVVKDLLGGGIIPFAR